MGWHEERRRNIAPPFANYPTAKLERTVQEAFEGIERGEYLDPLDFQDLCAAEFFLRQKRGKR